MEPGTDSFTGRTAASFQVYQKNDNQRFCHRIQCRIPISIKDVQTQWEIEARCINISKGGIGIEIIDDEEILMKIQDRLEIWIHLSDGLRPIHRFGRLVWFRQVSHLNYHGGVKLEAGLRVSGS